MAEFNFYWISYEKMYLNMRTIFVHMNITYSCIMHPYLHVGVHISPWTHIEAWHNDVGPTTFTVSKETKFIFSFFFHFVFISFKYIFVQWSGFDKQSSIWLSTNYRELEPWSWREEKSQNLPPWLTILISLNPQQVLHLWNFNTDGNW